ncbi:MAG TPA: hypothetical protein VK633_11760, partial [Verrucomicrobiae bacterium]|nr:hypothetical protein [Verrucomicrobiae bacterium]
YLLLRYLSFLCEWSHSFSRLFTLVRTCLWKKWDLLSLLDIYGTAEGTFAIWPGPSRPISLAWDETYGTAPRPLTKRFSPPCNHR